MTKAEINKVLKSIGFGFVKMQVNMYRDKTHSSKTKGLRGGSIGPLAAQYGHEGEASGCPRVDCYR